MSPQFSETLQDLITKARIVEFTDWFQPPATIALLQAADDEKRYLTDADLEQIQNQPIQNQPIQNQPIESRSPHPLTLPTAIAAVRLLRDQVVDIVDEARSQVLTTFPTITEPGGDLYPPKRAEACWRDFWHFLRCITYGIASQNDQYVSPEGLHYMGLLYQELNVPLDAMVTGLEGIKVASLKRLPIEHHAALAPYFDHLIDRMRQLRH